MRELSAPDIFPDIASHGTLVPASRLEVNPPGFRKVPLRQRGETARIWLAVQPPLPRCVTKNGIDPSWAQPKRRLAWRGEIEKKFSFPFPLDGAGSIGRHGGRSRRAHMHGIFSFGRGPMGKNELASCPAVAPPCRFEARNANARNATECSCEIA